jgi:hypothetical protein
MPCNANVNWTPADHPVAGAAAVAVVVVVVVAVRVAADAWPSRRGSLTCFAP